VADIRIIVDYEDGRGHRSPAPLIGDGTGVSKPAPTVSSHDVCLGMNAWSLWQTMREAGGVLWTPHLAAILAAATVAMVGNGGNGSSAAPGGIGLTRVFGNNGSNGIDTVSGFPFTLAQSSGAGENNNRSTDLALSVGGVSTSAPRSVVDVTAPAVGVAVPAAAPLASGESGASVGGATVASLPSTGIGGGALSGSAGSLLLLIGSGLSALGALRTRGSRPGVR
jgi:hypothetical protein